MNQTRPQKTTDDEAAKNVQSSYQSDLHGQGLVRGGAALQLLQGFALVGHRRMIVPVLAAGVGVGVAAAQAGVGAPVGQAVGPGQVVDGERRAGGDVGKVGELAQVVVVLGGGGGELVRLLPHALLGLSGVARYEGINSSECAVDWRCE